MSTSTPVPEPCSISLSKNVALECALTGVRFAPLRQMRRIQNAILGAGSIGLLVAVLAATNHDVRRFVMNVLAGDASELERVTQPVNRAARIVIETVNEYRTDDAPLFAFAVLAAVLFGFLFKA